MYGNSNKNPSVSATIKVEKQEYPTNQQENNAGNMLTSSSSTTPLSNYRFPSSSGAGNSNAQLANNTTTSFPPSTSVTFSSINSASGVGSTSSTSTKSHKTLPRKPPPTLDNFWPNILEEVRAIQNVDAKHQALPLARIKKIMKLDENAKMIAAEAPLLFAKACEYFIQELTMRAWIHTEDSKRRTLQRSDIAQAIANYDQFDFLIDIVPREDIKPAPSTKKEASQCSQSSPAATAAPSAASAAPSAAVVSTAVPSASAIGNVVTTASNANSVVGNAAHLPPNVIRLDPASAELLNFGIIPHEAVQQQQQQAQQQTNQTAHPVQIIQQAATNQAQPLQYFLTIPGANGQPPIVQPVQIQSQQQQAQQQQLSSAQIAGLNLVAAQPQQIILTAGPNGQLTATPASSTTQQQQTAIIAHNLAAAAAQHQQQQQQSQQQQQFQVLHQVVTPSGEFANVPVTINANQLNLLRLQMQQQQHQQQQQQHQQQQQQQQQGQQQQTPTQQQQNVNQTISGSGVSSATASYRSNC